MKQDKITFDNPVTYIKQETLGSGATGLVLLLKDERIDQVFACKKYILSPFAEDGDFFQYFKDEIKLLHLLYHRNVVRVFNYYLYPQCNTGYIIMEYVQGEKIDKYVADNPHTIDSLFEQVVEAFISIHNVGVMHRDIKPSNILVTRDGILKVIDFGLGKKVDIDSLPESNSLSLAGMYERPNDYRTYSFKTEVYFVGQLFLGLLKDHQIQNFKFYHIIERMCAKDPKDRIPSFIDVYNEMKTVEASTYDFDEEEKFVYRAFADSCLRILSTVDSDSTYRMDVEEVIRQLEQCLQDSSLEEEVQDSYQLISSFIVGRYNLSTRLKCPVSVLEDFIHLLKSNSVVKRKIILSNLWGRLNQIDRSFDLPY